MNVLIAPDTIENCPNCQEWVFPEYFHAVGYSHYHGEQDYYWKTCPNCNYKMSVDDFEEYVVLAIDVDQVE